MLKPIEPGCMALAVPHPTWNEPPNVVQVVDKGDLTNRLPCDRCKTNEHTWRCMGQYTKTGAIDIYCRCTLTRIDGGDPDQMTETDKELTV
jgi:hypothetical protein